MVYDYKHPRLCSSFLLIEEEEGCCMPHLQRSHFSRKTVVRNLMHFFPFSVLINEFLIAFEASKTTDAIEFGYRYFENLRFASRILPPARVILVRYSTNIDAIFTTLRITGILISMTLAWKMFQIKK
jgi:hypothetical protein